MLSSICSTFAAETFKNKKYHIKKREYEEDFDIKKMGAIALGFGCFCSCSFCSGQVETTIAADVCKPVLLAWSVTGRSLFAANTLVLVTRACL